MNVNNSTAAACYIAELLNINSSMNKTSVAILDSIREDLAEDISTVLNEEWAYIIVCLVEDVVS